ncbi:transcription antitermination factor NusB [Candidatus Absconditicoccus praedator]|uniref:transcription antitermination factor NusB n=1 Tax=Candidatus Absconditicoccus praedator TaxID=2735562 RepID=UPI001E3A06FC|nr:transcription antitermination factor NusB [Candidatus Absconditicoccus praedator]UFX82804.1 hypothetical protein HLG78_01490 [Candidatus Absconditicoccus praedator]
MNIKSRIVSRKALFAYFYQKYFLEYLEERDIIFDDILKVDKLVNWNPVNTEERQKLKKEIKDMYPLGSWEEDILYIVKNILSKSDNEKIDFEFVSKIIVNYENNKDEVQTLVDKYAETFKNQEMDIVDRAIFLLGYLERTIIKTPKNLVLNEMIELAKRYGDEGSYKLINGIGHKIIV